MSMAYDVSPGGAGSQMTVSTAPLSASPPSDYFGLPTASHSGSTALTTPTMSSPGIPKPAASFHSLQDIAEAVEVNPLGLGPPPGFDYPSDSGVDPMYIEDDGGVDDDVDVRRGPSVRSRASEYEASISTHSTHSSHGVGLGIGLGAPRSPSSLSGRKSPNRFPSNPERPGSPMRLPPSPHLHSNQRHSSPRHSPAPAPPSPRAQPRSPLRLPPASPNLRAPSPLGQTPPTMPEAPTLPDPTPVPRALPQPPMPPQPSTPPRGQRVPVPLTAPPARNYEDSSPGLHRGRGSTKRMVAAWEGGQPFAQDMTPPRSRPLPQPGSAPALGALSPTSPSPRRLNPRYLDEKPLPIPAARPIPASKTMPWPPPNSARPKPGGIKLPAPLAGGTPRSPPQLRSPSSWSPLQSDKRDKRRINLNGDVESPKSPTRPNALGKSPIKRSPFKEIKNVFNGLRKHKHKEDKHTGWGTAAVGVHADEPRQFMSLDEEAGWFAQPLRHPQPGMHSPCSTDHKMDRMGDVEMGDDLPEPQQEGTLRSSPALYLAPVPSTPNRWGSWMTAWARLSAQVLTVTYVPVIGGSPHGPPFRSIPEPKTNSRPDEELQMRDCVEVRSLRPAEVRGRGVPQAPEGAGSEVLELVFAQGMKRYLAVEGVAGRLGWVSAIWDVLLACKQEPGANTTLPPPSPSLQSLHHFRDIQEQPVYKVGDTWVARSDYRFSFSSAGNTPETEQAPVLPNQPVLKASPLGATEGTRPPEPGEVVRFQPGHAVSVPDAAAAIEQLKDDNDDDDVPPPLPPKTRSRSTLIEERMRTFNAVNTPEKGSLEWPEPQMPQTEPVPRTAPLRIRRRDVSENTGAGSGGDTAGATTKGTGSTTSSSTPLRESAVRAFEVTATGGGARAPSRVRSSAMDARIRAWQPDPVDTPPPLSRAASDRSHATAFSFDPSDLNPSRSASQVRPRTDTHKDIDLAAVDAGLQRTLPVVPENKTAPRPAPVPAPQAERAAGLSGPRSPRARKIALAEIDKPVPLPVPQSVPRPTASTDTRPITPAETHRTSPKAATTPRRMNTRMLAAAAVFEPSIADRLSQSGGSSGSAAKSAPAASGAMMPKSPSLKAPVARATPSAGFLESLTAAARSEVSAASSAQPASSVAKPAVSSSKPETTRSAPLKPSPTTPRRTLFVANPAPEPEPKRTQTPARSAVSTSRVDAAKAALLKSPPLDTPKASAALSPRDTASAPGVPALSRHFTTMSKVDDASVLSRYTTERESIGGVLDHYALTPSTQARSTLSAAQPVAGARAMSTESVIGSQSQSDATEEATVPAVLARSAERLSPASTGTDPTVLARLDTTSNELTRRLDDVQTGVNMLSGSVGTMSAMIHAREAREESDAAVLGPGGLPERLDALNEGLQSIHGCVATLPPDLNEKLNALGTDLRGVQMVLYESSAQIAAMAAKDAAEGVKDPQDKDLPPPPSEPAPEPQLPEIHAKLDALATLIQEVLSRQGQLAATTAALGAAGGAAGAAAASKESEAVVPKDLPKEGGQNLSREAPVVDEKAAAPEASPAADMATAAQLAEVQGLVSKLAEERATQTQQTADIAKYLSELNGWLEKFVNNSGSELEGMNRRLDGMLATGEEGPTGAIADLHRKLDEQAAAGAAATPVAGEGGVQAQRLDALVAMMGDERDRAAHQNGVMENVLSVLDKQRQDNENLLRAVATDLSTEIRGERVRFIEAMREATTMNMQIHVDEFKKALTNEVSQSMRELGTLREQKKALEHQIADLFTLIAKHGEGGKLAAASPSTPTLTVPGGFSTPDARGPRALPLPPH